MDEALSDLVGVVSRELDAQGWVRRELDVYGSAVFTRDASDGVMVVAELRAPDRKEWPVPVVVDVGVGYGPALNLMPLLTMDIHVMLVPDYAPPATSSYSTTIGDAADVPAAAGRIIGVISEHATRVADRFPDADAIERAIPRQRPAADGGRDEPDPHVGPYFDYDRHTQLRLALLAAAGRHDDARALLAVYSTRHDGKPISRADRRFIRQLTRWLDAGGPTAAPVGDTLALLPRDPNLTRSFESPLPSLDLRSSWAAAQARGSARSAAQEAVKVRAAGKTVDEIAAMLAAEYEQRQVDISRDELAVTAEALHTEQRLKGQPFGRARLAVKMISMFGGAGRDVLRTVRSKPQDLPLWLRPPERASYPMTCTGHNTEITLDADAYDWLSSAWTQTPRRIGPTATVQVWLTADNETADLIAHIGERKIGTIAARRAGAFRQTLNAAALFDEDPVTRGFLTNTGESAQLILTIPTPNSTQPQG